MKKNKLLKTLLATLFWVAVWYLLACRMEQPLLLPSPEHVLRRWGELVVSAEFWRITLTSIGRILLGTAAAMVLGVALAVLTVASSLAHALIAPVMTLVQAAPVASFVILILLWVDRDFLPAIICAMMVLPVVWSNVCTGIRQTDRQLLEMAKVSKLSPLRVLRRIWVPSVMPYFRAACGSALGLGWKAGIAAEVLAVPKVAMGRMISDAKLYLLTEDLFAWTLTVVLLSLALQKLVLHFLKGRGGYAGNA